MKLEAADVVSIENWPVFVLPDTDEGVLEVEPLTNIEDIPMPALIIH